MKYCVLILDNIRSVENAGSIFRTSEGLGVRKVILVGTTPAPLDRFGRPRKDFMKVSLGAEKTIEWEYKKEIGPVLKELKKEGFKIYALEQSSKSKNLKDFEPGNNFVLVVGNEVDGVSKTALDLADEILEIEMKGEKESLNVSVSTGVALFELLK